MNKTVRKYLLFEKWLYLVVLFLSHFPIYMGKYGKIRIAMVSQLFRRQARGCHLKLIYARVNDDHILYKRATFVSGLGVSLVS